MIDLDNLEEIKKLDPKDVYGSTKLFVAQCQQMLDEYFDKDLVSDEYRKAGNVVIAGMGGSAYGGYIALSLFPEELKKPLMLVNDYRLPGFVDQNSVVMGISYSGSTEEVLSATLDGKERGAKVTGFSSGGKLSEFFKENNYPGFSFDPKNNPSGQPRLGTGYITLGAFIMLKMLDVLPLAKSELQVAIDGVKSNQYKIEQEAKEIAKKMQGYIPVIMASGHLVGNAHIMRNQFNETSKSFSAFEDIPELNHHLMEGLKNPSDKKLKVLFLNSNLYSELHSKRIELTQDVIHKNNVEFEIFDAPGGTKLSQVLSLLSFGGYLTLYLALLYGQDPSLIPWVDYFKEQLKK